MFTSPTIGCIAKAIYGQTIFSVTKLLKSWAHAQSQCGTSLLAYVDQTKPILQLKFAAVHSPSELCYWSIGGVCVTQINQPGAFWTQIELECMATSFD